MGSFALQVNTLRRVSYLAFKKLIVMADITDWLWHHFFWVQNPWHKTAQGGCVLYLLSVCPWLDNWITYSSHRYKYIIRKANQIFCLWEIDLGNTKKQQRKFWNRRNLGGVSRKQKLWIERCTTGGENKAVRTDSKANEKEQKYVKKRSGRSWETQRKGYGP